MLLYGLILLGLGVDFGKRQGRESMGQGGNRKANCNNYSLKTARKSTGQNVILNYHLARTHEDKKYNTKPLELI